MKRIAPLVAALAVCFSMTSAALAGDAEDLKGEWIVESMFGEAPPPGMEMRIEFDGESTVKMTMTANGQEQMSEEASYTATDDGELTVTTADGEEDSSTWEIDDDGKLHITPKEEGGPVIVLRRAE